MKNYSNISKETKSDTAISENSKKQPAKKLAVDKSSLVKFAQNINQNIVEDNSVPNSTELLDETANKANLPKEKTSAISNIVESAVQTALKDDAKESKSDKDVSNITSSIVESALDTVLPNRKKPVFTTIVEADTSNLSAAEKKTIAKQKLLKKKKENLKKKPSSTTSKAPVMQMNYDAAKLSINAINRLTEAIEANNTATYDFDIKRDGNSIVQIRAKKTPGRKIAITENKTTH